jgi:phenylalanyl-tRNA synthetase beta chain
LAPGVVDAYPAPLEPRQIKLRFEKANQLLGIEIPASQQVDYLRRLELQPLEDKATSGTGTQPAAGASDAIAPGDSCVFIIPSFRVDLKREADLIEEVGRMFGVDRIPSRTLLGTVGANPYDRYHDQLAEVRRILCGLGLNEAQGQTLIPETAAQRITTDYLRLQNPLSGDMNVLRPSLIPGLLDALQYNLNRKVTDVALFEIGRIFLRGENGPVEERRLTLTLTGRRGLTFWRGEDREARCDFYDLKGVLEVFFRHFGVRGVVYEKPSAPGSFYAQHAILRWGKQSLGVIGLLHPMLAKAYDLRDAVLVAELSVDLLISRRNPGRVYQNLPMQPSIRRDIALLVPEAVTHEAVLAAMKQAKLPNLENIELFDVFRGRNIAEGQKSMAYAMIYRHPERTLTDNEVNAAHQKLVQHLQQHLNATVRES